MTVKALRTPEERFSLLPAFPYQPKYFDDLNGFESLRMAYIDEGPVDARNVFLCLHGEPSWSYLYRKMIPIFVAAGHRVIAPDLFGFGRSDKPIKESDYSFDSHRNSLVSLIERLDLSGVTLVCQDWGGILGLSIPVDMPQRFSNLLVMNTFIPVGDGASKGFLQWRGFAEKVTEIPVGGMLAIDAPGQVNLLDVLAYDAPFPDNSYKAGVRVFPKLVPVEPGMEGIADGIKARDFWKNQWQGKTYMAIGMRDSVLGEPAMLQLKSFIRNCPEPLKLEEAGHFVQEYGENIAKQALDHFEL